MVNFRDVVKFRRFRIGETTTDLLWEIKKLEERIKEKDKIIKELEDEIEVLKRRKP